MQYFLPIHTYARCVAHKGPNANQNREKWQKAQKKQYEIAKIHPKNITSKYAGMVKYVTENSCKTYEQNMQNTHFWQI